ncbi:hypothetical protein AB0469_16855 [Streptomyces sp. NPDC093801]|uniref:hypothetical protein n=1 Tax=Streptomyces sp. NPDC093801 TaxID=3155203 RepID=UPI003450017F
MTTTPPAAPSPAKAWTAAAALLLSLALAACGAHVAGRAAPPSPLPASSTCGPGAADLPTEERGGSAPEPPTEDQTATAPQPPTEEDPGTPQPPTEEDPGTPQPPTEEDPGTPQPPTEEDPGASQPPTDQDPGTPGPPTDGGDGGTGSARPCPVVDGWYDMTREFEAYYARHRTAADGLMPPGSVKEVRVHKAGGTSQARVAFTTGSVGKGLGEDARRVAQVFADWRHEVYGDTGTVRVRGAGGNGAADLSW